MMKDNRCTSLAAIVLATVVFCNPRPATAQGVPDYDFSWATITHAGNRAANPIEAPILQEFPAPGRVTYEYRVAKTEVTAAQWFEFVQAYAPYYTGSRSDSAFTGLSIVPGSTDPALPPDYQLVSGEEHRPATMSWRFAARYVNWLGNGKGSELVAFERGAYDTGTFTQNADGSYNDQLTRSPNATFWIPSLDEWTKAVYFDPTRYGTGQAGYWMHPLGSDTPAVPGPPGMGQTSGGVPGASSLRIDVGSYPDALTPWGLLDASGGVQEWTETNAGPSGLNFLRYTRSSTAGSGFYADSDRLDEYWLNSGSITGAAVTGLRIASTIPTPPTLIGLYLSLMLTARWRKR